MVGEFQQSFALIDADGRLVDWDTGFERELHNAAHLIRIVMTASRAS